MMEFPTMPNLRQWLLTVALLLAAGVAGTQPALGAPATIPENARATSYGSGWECKPGYQRTGAAGCVAIVVPGNAFPTNDTYGRGWDCSRGHRLVDGACVGVQVPENAFLTAAGDSWECERSYRQTGKACTAISVPKNAFLTDIVYGSGWSCDRGYQARDGACHA
jgi:hypothetical protein